MRFWDTYNLHLLTLACLCVAVYLGVCWETMPPLKRALGFFVIGITLHEWEETRFPGGFFDLMTRKFGISEYTPQQVGRAHGAAVIAIVFFAFVPFLLSDIRWLALVSGVLGVFEAFIHVAGIRIHRLKYPYSPGMATALVCLLPSSVLIFTYAAPGAGWGWAAAIAYYLAVFAVMEVLVWRAFGISPKDLPQKMAKLRGGDGRR
ncbi:MULTISPECIES: HXXEE domain-containing protein [unclassified Adlercreutzia]|uniref:HXXEE domain-containing protein n=1 Tax=unclassified Adlercreutzia TaxID=2636013 RepID=UPI0013EC1525|nr:MULTISPECIES: HXXEE domain-containing protein [unclassified Adlercreutzia]